MTTAKLFSLCPTAFPEHSDPTKASKRAKRTVKETQYCCIECSLEIAHVCILLYLKLALVESRCVRAYQGKYGHREILSGLRWGFACSQGRRKHTGRLSIKNFM